MSLVPYKNEEHQFCGVLLGGRGSVPSQPLFSSDTFTAAVVTSRHRCPVCSVHIIECSVHCLVCFSVVQCAH